MIYNSPDAWTLSCTSEEKTSKTPMNKLALVVDNGNAGTIEPTRSPALLFQGNVGIKNSLANTHAVGFIQFITDYEFVVTYERTRLDLLVPVPVSDGGCARAPAEYRTPAHLPHAGFPWYQPPLLVQHNSGPCKFYGTEVNDAPAWSFPWWREATDKTDTLKRLKRRHRFETWFVVYDLTLNKVEKAFARWEWEHRAEFTFDINRPRGHPGRFMMLKCENNELSRTVEPITSIPPLAMIGPSANDRAKHSGRWSLLPKHSAASVVALP